MVLEDGVSVDGCRVDVTRGICKGVEDSMNRSGTLDGKSDVSLITGLLQKKRRIASTKGNIESCMAFLPAFVQTQEMYLKISDRIGRSQTQVQLLR